MFLKTSSKYALVGLGFISKRHDDSIKKVGGELLLACDIDNTKFGLGVMCTRDYRFLTALPRWKDVDTVVICTPNDLHVEISKWAVRHGKKAICEKPLAISSAELLTIQDEQDIYTVMQLRHHPMMKVLRGKDLSEIEDAHLYVRVKRGPDYWTGWKGKEERSGGILFNLGVHYLDAMLELFGKDYEIVESKVSEREAFSVVRFKTLRKPVRMTFSITDTDEGQDRFLMLNDEKYRFSDKDNLSFEDLHTEVYKDFLDGKGVRPAELVPLTRFIEELKSYGVQAV